jgi:hypothetical protein
METLSMPDASPGIAQTLVTVVIGGAIALAGTWLGPWITERHKEKTERKKKLADKFEAMVGAIYQFDHWLDTERNRALGAATSEPTVSPFAKIQAIAAVYFPRFDPLIQELDKKTSAYILWIESTNFARISGKLDKLPDGLSEVMNPYIAALEKLRDELKKFAHSHF